MKYLPAQYNNNNNNNSNNNNDSERADLRQAGRFLTFCDVFVCCNNTLYCGHFRKQTENEPVKYNGNLNM